MVVVITFDDVAASYVNMLLFTSVGVTNEILDQKKLFKDRYCHLCAFSV